VNPDLLRKKDRGRPAKEDPDAGVADGKEGAKKTSGAWAVRRRFKLWSVTVHLDYDSGLSPKVHLDHGCE